MPALLIRQRVTDYARWKQAFAEQTHARSANGCEGVQVFRNPDDPNETIVILTWDSLVRAWLFSQSDDLLESFDNDHAEIWLLDDAP